MESPNLLLPDGWSVVTADAVRYELRVREPDGYTGAKAHGSLEAVVAVVRLHFVAAAIEAARRAEQTAAVRQWIADRPDRLLGDGPLLAGCAYHLRHVAAVEATVQQLVRDHNLTLDRVATVTTQRDGLRTEVFEDDRLVRTISAVPVR